MPVPPSKTKIWFVSVRISVHEVFPPYPMFSFCGVGVEPRTPQNRTRIEAFSLRNGSINTGQTKLQETWVFEPDFGSLSSSRRRRLPNGLHPFPDSTDLVQP